MPADPFAPGPIKVPNFGGGSKVTSKNLPASLRDAIGLGNVKTVRRVGRNAGVSDRDLKALLAFTKQQQPHGFVGKVESDISDTLHGLPKGIAKLGYGAAKEATAIPRLGVRATLGKPISQDELIGALPVVGQLYGAAKGAATGKMNPDNPFSSGLGVSLRNTGLRIAHPKKAIKDYSAHPFSTALEDVGNVAIGAGAASKAAELAGAAGTAEKLATLSRAGTDVANLPFLPVSATARGANALLKRLGESGLGNSEVARILRLSPDARALKPVLRGGEEAAAQATNQIAKVTRAQEKLLPRVEEQQAMFLTGQGQVESLARARETLPGPAFTALVKRELGDFSPDAVNLAVDAATGRNPDLAARIDRALGTGSTARATREAGYLSRGGESRVEQAGAEALSRPVAEALKGPLAKLEKAQKAAEQATLKADANRGRLARVQAEAGPMNAPGKPARYAFDIPAVQEIGTGRVSHYIKEDVRLARSLGKEETRQKVLDNLAESAKTRAARLEAKVRDTKANVEASVGAAPARLRPALATNRAVVQAITEHENQLRGAGLPEAATQVSKVADEIPNTLAALEAAGVNPDHFINPREQQAGGTSPSGQALPRPKGRMSEARQRKMQGAHDFTLRAQARAEVVRAREVVAQQTADQVAQLPFMQKAGDLAGPLGELPTRAELNARGLEAWSPTGLFETATQIGPDTLVMPKPLFDSFRNYYTPKKWERLFEIGYDPLTRAFKTVVLPLSVSWNVGNAVTNMLMATIGGGVDPFTLAKEIGSTLAEHRRTGEWNAPDRVFSTGATHEALDFLGGKVPKDMGRVRRAAHVANTPIRGLAQTGYKVNETIDNVFRSAVYNAKIHKGYSPEVAMKMSLRAMGDFTKMTPFERSVVRRAVPFYAWLRHMSQTALRLPIEHPFRTAWVLSMSNEFADPQAWEGLLPSFMQGFVPLGGDSALSVQNFMPFSNPFAIKNLGGNLSPQIKMLLANLPGSPARGINAFTGRPYSRRPGTGRTDEFGRELPTAPSILEQLRQIPPQARLFDALTGRKDVARYESGQTVLTRGPDGKLTTIKTPQSDLTAISKALGIPITSQKQLKAIVDSIIAKQKTTYQQAHRVKNTKSGGLSLPKVNTGGF